MKKTGTLRKSFLMVLAGMFIATLLIVSAPGRSDAQESDCAAVWQKWESVVRDLSAKVNEFSALQDTPVERITQRPILNGSADKTLARRIAEALQVKEEILKAKRTECQALLGLEEQAFQELQAQCQNGKNNLGKDAKKLVKQRTALLEKVTVTIADVREVEGRESGFPYSAGVGQQQENYWQSYQQMYRRWWGY
ncbi:MAG: hypothetical protein HY914_12595 [Desulfomonile tiedjei]|nr:hypothetical protein [Desulfomonile tiedjei]